MGRTESDFYVAIAIDFGTSRSGFAYAFPGKEPVVVNAYYDWPGRRVQRYPKTATRLLYNPARQVIAWGYEAKNALANIRRDDKERIAQGQKAEAPGYFLFEKFKLDLFEGKKRYGEPYITDQGEEFWVVDIIADYLREMKEFALKQILPDEQRQRYEKKILWCLTVPAIWGEREKQLMRRAAEKAELIGTQSSEIGRLLFALEPEAAALHCWENDLNVGARRPGTCFMVVDAGGGTVDLIVFEVTANQGLKEVVRGSGDLYGSTRIDREFEMYLRSMFTDEVIQELHDEYPLEYLDLMGLWETVKCEFDHRTDYPRHIPIIQRLLKIYKKRKPDLYAELEKRGEDEYITLKPEKMRKFFEPAIEGIVKLVQEQFQSLKGKRCDFLFLVGGFASSEFLQEEIRNAFGTRARVIIPPEPGAAIEMGAVSFALDLSVIQSRLARMTYGIGMYLDYEPSRDQGRETRKHSRDGRVMCERFKIFATIDQSIAINESFRHEIYPMERDQDSLSIEIYGSDRKDVRYIDEESVVRLGRVRITRNDLRDGYDWEVHVTMFFGQTEIAVEVKDPRRNSIEKTRLDFTSVYTNVFI